MNSGIKSQAFKKITAITVCLALIFTVMTASLTASAESYTYADSIVLKPDFADSTWQAGSVVSIPFTAFSFDYYLTAQKYCVNIYDSSKHLLNTADGYFNRSLSTTDLTVTWNSYGYGAGKYYVEYYSTYNTDLKGTFFPFNLAYGVNNPDFSLQSIMGIKSGNKAMIPRWISVGNGYDVIWTSNNTDVVTVDDFGIVTAKSEGTATVTGTYNKYGIKIKSTCFVRVGIYADVFKEDWYYGAIKLATEKGIFKGYENGAFGPCDYIQRQDFAVLLARVEGVDLSDYDKPSRFGDVAEGYYRAAVNWADKNGISTGYTNGRFGVGDPMTREQLVTVLYRYAKLNGYDTDITSAKAKSYSDYRYVSDFAKTAVNWAIEKGIISGTDPAHIDPLGSAARAQVAQIFKNISERPVPVYDLTNERVGQYLTGIDYSNDIGTHGYNSSFVTSYMINLPLLPYKSDEPAPVTLTCNTTGTVSQTVEISEVYSSEKPLTYSFPTGTTEYGIYNLIPSRRYCYRIIIDGNIAKSGEFRTSGTLRMLKIDGINNVRDLGGWGNIKYGLLFRGTEFDNATNRGQITADGIYQLCEQVGVKAELDLDENYGTPLTDITYDNIRVTAYVKGLSDTGVQANYAECLRVIIRNLQNNKPTYFHCKAGADRTGTFAFIIEALCGVSESDLSKEWELTSFWHWDYTGNNFTRRRTADNSYMFGEMCKWFYENYSGDTINKCVYNYCLSIGITAEEIQTLRNLLLNE